MKAGKKQAKALAARQKGFAAMVAAPKQSFRKPGSRPGKTEREGKFPRPVVLEVEA